MSESTKASVKTRESKTGNSSFHANKTNVPALTNSPIDQIYSLQRTVGNREVEKLLRSGLIQAKLTIGQAVAKPVFQPQTAAPPSAPVIRAKLKVGEPDDKFEQEADRVAGLTGNDNGSHGVWRAGPMSLQTHTAIAASTAKCSVQPLSRPLQRKCACGGIPGPTGECEKCREKRLGRQHHAGIHVERRGVPSIVREVLSSSGQPLDAATRSFMEPRFGHDFSQVRVHTDANAAASARAVNALAYTVGHDVVFGANKYAPASQNGRGLLAHELAHTIQQRSASGAPPSADPDGIFESSADTAGRAVANGRGVSGDLPACGVGLSRAAVPLEELPDEELQEKLNQVTEKLKNPAYEGREKDLNWYRRLTAAVQSKAKAREPKAPAPSPPPPPPAPPAPPAPDPRAEREAAVKEAEALLARMETEAKEDDDDEGAVAPIRKGARRRQAVPQRPTTLSLLTPDEASGGQSFTDEQIYKEYNEAKKRIDEQISKEREISKIPYKQRLNRVRDSLQAKSSHWLLSKGSP